MFKHVENLIVGQGLAGSAMAWTLHWSGQSLLILDRGERNTASRVAAGLVTPITGKRLVRSQDFDEYWAAALAFYRRVELETGRSFFEDTRMLRLFADHSACTAFLDRSEIEAVAGVASWRGRLQTDGREQSGITMTPAARLKVKAYLSATKEHFLSCDSYAQGDIDFVKDVVISESMIRVDSRDLTADRMILCQGTQANELFPKVPNNPSRGDILTVRIPNYERTEVVHRSIWIAPNSDCTQTVGSTYDWRNTNAVPTAAGRAEVQEKLSRMVDGPVIVEHHEAGVRPTMKDYEPVIGRHPKHSNVFILNGLGSKGTLRAPLMAAAVLSQIKGVGVQDTLRSYNRLLPEHREPPLTTQAQEAVKNVLRRGETAVDATVGNGFDTCFLSKIVGEEGRVIGFDIQQSALEATAKRLQAEDLHNVQLLHKGHETLSAVAEGTTLSAVMFNLGFLPRSDHQVTTQPETSVAAIRASIKLLRQGGVLTVLTYRGTRRWSGGI